MNKYQVLENSVSVPDGFNGINCTKCGRMFAVPVEDGINADQFICDDCTVAGAVQDMKDNPSDDIKKALGE